MIKMSSKPIRKTKAAQSTTGQSIKVDLFDLAGRKTGKVAVSAELSRAKANPRLVAQAIRVILSNQRRSLAQTKTRGEVRGSRIKIWRQKGTGRARHGDRYAPIFVGGGVAHGPTGKENWQLKLSKKMKRAALLAALKDKFEKNRIVAVDDLGKIKPKTKLAFGLIEGIKKEKKEKISASTLVVVEKNKENVNRAFSNLRGRKTARCLVTDLNPYSVLKANLLIFDSWSIKNFGQPKTAGGKKQ